MKLDVGMIVIEQVLNSLLGLKHGFYTLLYLWFFFTWRVRKKSKWSRIWERRL